LPLLFTFVLPRAISFYRKIKTAVRTRPPSRALPRDVARGVNILFLSVCVFLVQTISFRSDISEQNIFSVTNSRLHIPTDVLFTRLALLRPQGRLSPFDEVFKSKVTSPMCVNPLLLLKPTNNARAPVRYTYVSAQALLSTALSVIPRMTPHTCSIIYQPMSSYLTSCIFLVLVWQPPNLYLGSRLDSGEINSLLEH